MKGPLFTPQFILGVIVGIIGMNYQQKRGEK